MEKYLSPEAELVMFCSAEQLAFQVYSEGGSFGGNADIVSVTEPSEGFEDW